MDRIFRAMDFIQGATWTTWHSI